MTATLERPPTHERPANGGLPARRAVVRWAWRLFRREWRQQLLILTLVIVAVAATILGGAVAADSRQPATFGFGTAQDSATLRGSSAQISTELARIRDRFNPVEVIENSTRSIPGSISTYDLRAQDPRGPYGAPMLNLLTGRYPRAADEVAVTPGVASGLHLRVGDTWRQDGTSRRVVGTVQNPQSLLDQFALVLPGHVTAPTVVTALFDGHRASTSNLGVNVQTPDSVAQTNPLNPETITLAALVLGMLLIALVSIGGFTVLAQRRLRSIGMIESLGATDAHVSLVVRANGAVVGVVGAVAGFAISLIGWLIYRPTLEQSSHHLIGVFQLPWRVVALSMVLAVEATYFAASRPARAITRMPVVTALSGRPAPPKEVRRSAVPGIVLLIVAFLLFGYSGAHADGSGNGASELLLGLLALVPGMILLAPFCLSVVARAGRRLPIAPRLALRDLSRYRARSGSALAAISVGVLVAVVITLAAAARYGNALDYAGPNLASNQLALHADSATSSAAAVSLDSDARRIAAALGAHLVALETPDAGIDHIGPGRDWNGALYVATPRVLTALGIKSSDIRPDADIITMRPGLAGVSGLQFRYGNNSKVDSSFGAGPDSPAPPACTGATNCVAHPVIQTVSVLPAGTSAPNTLVTEHAVRTYHLSATAIDWFVYRSRPFSASDIRGAQATAAESHLLVESKNDQPTSSEVLNWATAFGILLALGVLAMSVGLIRSETAADLRTLAATGASSYSRRTLTAVTAGALGLLGALIGTAGGYIALIGWLRSNSLNGGLGALGNVPVANLLLILVGMPAVATIVGWVLAGREPSGIPRGGVE